MILKLFRQYINFFQSSFYLLYISYGRSSGCFVYQSLTSILLFLTGQTWTLIPLAWVFAGLFAIPMLVTFFIKEAFNMKHCMIEFSEQWMWQVSLHLSAFLYYFNCFHQFRS